MMKWLCFVNTYDFRSRLVISIEITAKYEFYLVDLNRMSFNTKLSLTTRMENVSKMMEEEVFARKFSKAYSEFCTRYTEEEVFKKLYHFIKKHKFRVFIKDSTRPFRRMLKK